ncbi:glycosyltransferase [Patescibacteria group bacterium]|nr:glycosyltransferase [Patescibacteria group bacterium]
MNKKIKISYIIPTLDKGGAERFFIDLIKNLDKEKFEASLILYKRGGDWLEELKALNLKIVILEKKKRLDLKNFLALKKAIKEIGPDIIHTQLGADIYGVLAGRLAGVSKIISTEVNTNNDEGFFYNLVKRFSLKFVNKVVAVSSAVKEETERRYALNSKKIEVIYNGIELGRFKLGIRNFDNNRADFVFGTIGRLSEQKGHKYLIKAFSKIKNKKAKLLIAGEGELKAELETEIKALKLTRRVKLVGQVSAPDFLSSLDAFVLPSLWEGMGIVLVEAALSGLPIIATKVGGISEVVSEEEASLIKLESQGSKNLNENNFIKDLSLALDNLIDNYNTIEVATKIEKANKKVRANFDIKKISVDYEKLYQKRI